jgi:hypothetical protein
MTAPTDVITTRARSEQRPAHVLAGPPLAIGAVVLVIAGVLIGIVGGSPATTRPAARS